MNSRSESGPKPNVGVIGGGPWGVALAVAASRTGGEVTLHTRRRDHATTLRNIRTTESFAEIARAHLLVIAVPSTAVQEVARSLGDHLDGSHLVIHGVRGLSVDHLETMTDIIRRETPVRRLGALGGPVQASELMEGRTSAMVCGSHYPEVIAAAMRVFEHTTLRVYGTADLRGLEWASALVGCLSVGLGYADEAGAGPGLLAVLASRGVEEVARIAAATGADERTVLGLGGYGDLLASMRLPDRPEVVLGRTLAKGRPLAEAISLAKLRVEAVALIPKVADFAKAARVHAPIFEALAKALEGMAPAAILETMFAA